MDEKVQVVARVGYLLSEETQIQETKIQTHPRVAEFPEMSCGVCFDVSTEYTVPYHQKCHLSKESSKAAAHRRSVSIKPRAPVTFLNLSQDFNRLNYS